MEVWALSMMVTAAIVLGLQQSPALSPPPVPPPPPAATGPVDDLPGSVHRIERALATLPAIDVKQQHPVFRVDVYGRKPSLEDFLGEKFWLGNAPYGGMTHQEFMNMVTPKEVQGYAGLSGRYLVATTALTLAEEWAVKQAIHKYQDARTAREQDAARQEVLNALAALKRARQEAGLPDR